MFQIRAFITAILLFPAINYAQHTDEINSNRPGESMSAFAVGKTVIQVETGVFGIQESHSLKKYDANGFSADLQLRYGAFRESLEFIADVQYLKETFAYPMNTVDKSDFKQLVLGAKYLIYDPNKGYKREINLHSWQANNKFNWHQVIPAVAVYAGANFSAAGNPYSFTPEASISPKVALILQNHLGDGSWVFVTNIIYNYIITDYPSLSYILTLTKGINEKWSAFIENQGIQSDFYSDEIIRGGAAFLINKNMQVDASVSTNFKNTPSIFYGGVGLSWRWDGKYKEVKLLTKEAEAAERQAKKTNSKKGFQKEKQDKKKKK